MTTISDKDRAAADDALVAAVEAEHTEKEEA